MNRKNTFLLSTPYGLWMLGFTIIPLLMILYYGLTGQNGRSEERRVGKECRL